MLRGNKSSSYLVVLSKLNPAVGTSRTLDSAIVHQTARPVRGSLRLSVTSASLSVLE